MELVRIGFPRFVDDASCALSVAIVLWPITLVWWCEYSASFKTNFNLCFSLCIDNDKGIWRRVSTRVPCMQPFCVLIQIFIFSCSTWNKAELIPHLLSSTNMLFCDALHCLHSNVGSFQWLRQLCGGSSEKCSLTLPRAYYGVAYPFLLQALVIHDRFVKWAVWWLSFI